MRDEQPGVDQLLRTEGYRFEFFQAVRLLQRLKTERRPIGHNYAPEDEVVRFKSHHSLAFPASEIYEIASAPESGQHEVMWVNFMGLAGIQGALPLEVASLLADPALKAETAAAREFLDLFSHRLISLFYRAWEKYHFPVAYESGERDAFSDHLFCLIGLGTPGLRGRLRIDDQILLFYAGLLAQRPRSAVSLEGILCDYFDVPVEVVQFQGQWFELNPDALSTLGAHGQNNELGVTAVLWERVWDPQARFRVEIGPLTYAQFIDFLPGAGGYVHAVELTRFFVGEDVNFELRPILKREEVPWCVLGQDPSVRLGWSMWLKERELEEDVPQPVFEARVSAA